MNNLIFHEALLTLLLVVVADQLVNANDGFVAGVVRVVHCGTVKWAQAAVTFSGHRVVLCNRDGLLMGDEEAVVVVLVRCPAPDSDRRARPKQVDGRPDGRGQRGKVTHHR